jgi:hypothetical protein
MTNDKPMHPLYASVLATITETPGLTSPQIAEKNKDLEDAAQASKTLYTMMQKGIVTRATNSAGAYAYYASLADAPVLVAEPVAKETGSPEPVAKTPAFFLLIDGMMEQFVSLAYAKDAAMALPDPKVPIFVLAGTMTKTVVFEEAK